MEYGKVNEVIEAGMVKLAKNELETERNMGSDYIDYDLIYKMLSEKTDLSSEEIDSIMEEWESSYEVPEEYEEIANSWTTDDEEEVITRYAESDWWEFHCDFLAEADEATLTELFDMWEYEEFSELEKDYKAYHILKENWPDDWGKLSVEEVNNIVSYPRSFSDMCEKITANISWVQKTYGKRFIDDERKLKELLDMSEYKASYFGDYDDNNLTEYEQSEVSLYKSFVYAEGLDFNDKSIALYCMKVNCEWDNDELEDWCIMHYRTTLLGNERSILESNWIGDL